ncbi:MAG: hypothetical protein BJBARM5_0393 [Candidatus Parvarchaeum acidophilus ARMAN-5]|jgi:hypothetical protein|uniref:Uncharacterized protein n=1 Tax=Candidatus Parvarchaeum acidophilus ARMAN-5 TaxID=662762 RepID=D6GV85_PARA5|nr:MAG: conserved hypothetical protein [Candidatus Parvarchaeum acidophilus ARMAN-5]
MDAVKLKLRSLIIMIVAIVVFISAVVIYLLVFVNGSATTAIGNNWFSIKGASPIINNGKLWVNFAGIEGCQYCAIERYAFFDALSNFGNWTYYGKNVDLNTLPTSNYSNTPQTNTLFYHAYEGDWTLNFLNPNLKYTSNYVNFTSEELYNDQYPNPTPLQSFTPLEQQYASKYDSGGAVPFSVIGGNFFEVGAGSSLAPDGTPIIFAGNGTGYMPSYIISQFNTSSSTISKGITEEADYITSMICSDINNAAPVCSSPSLPKV